MIKKYYECYFKSDVVLPASSNTQGNISLSDFISGSNFLGMVAKAYDSFAEDSFEVFHGGDVKFGDAHLVIEGNTSYKVPLSFHNLKTGKGSFNRLHLNDSEEQELRDNQQQLKQIRNGFINDKLSYMTPEYNYSQKSAYDKTNRHSKESGMFGYSALQSGSTWRFAITYSDEKHISKIEENLLGSQKLGKSKTAQYGDIVISSIEAPEQLSTYTPNNDTTYLYANSRLALFSEDGDFTLEPTIENLGLKSGDIDWKNSFIQTSSYTSYNYKRQTDEYTRLCINKGSVIAIKGLKESLEDSFCIGAFLSDGFGEILVNPSFLEHKKPNLVQCAEVFNEAKNLQVDENLIAYLKAKKDEENKKFDVASHVQRVYNSLKGPNKSQWGEIRSLATASQGRDELMQKIEDYIENGIAKKQWDKIKLKFYAEIEESQSPLEFTKLLAMIISKHTKGAEK